MSYLVKVSVALLTFTVGVVCASLWVALHAALIENPAPINVRTLPSLEAPIQSESNDGEFPERGNCSCGNATLVKSRMVSVCVWNGKILRKPAPTYPPLAKAAGVKGDVEVQVVVGETGEVIWAEARNGHPLLRQAARDAACKAFFTTTLLSGQPVQVRGILTYKFMLQ